ncbi:MAG: hypothetical protein A3F13_02535 [Gammaproteobacteria bacterium RIFCSPHIGHO2_12_FULL_40_19]|nr:MAG: hypothetical protein A3F13_02535 [Gammaproteobacteria bacterium RIFCSPHIGHO2_12_FULL_40_19]
MKKKNEDNVIDLVLSDELPHLGNGDALGTWYKEIFSQKCYIRLHDRWKYIGRNKDFPPDTEKWIKIAHPLDIKE